MSKRRAVGSISESELRFDDLFNSHYAAVHRYCFRRLGPVDAEDATADVFAIAWRRLHEMPDGPASLAWLFGVAYRVVGNRYRSRRRTASLVSRLRGTLTESASVSASPDDEHDEAWLLRAALESLSTTDGEILRLSAWEGLTRSEISAVLGIKENAVDQRLHRARRRLGERLASLSDTPDLNVKEANA